MDLSFLPTANAALNGLATVLLVTGRMLIRKRRIDAHRRVMLGAFAVSCLFLALYVIHKAWRGFESTPFNAEGTAKLVYLSILFSHLALAMAVPVLAIALLRLARRGRFDTHRRLARVAWPIWMYVSVTGVVIYLLLYPLNPPPAGRAAAAAPGSAADGGPSALRIRPKWANPQAAGTARSVRPPRAGHAAAEGFGVLSAVPSFPRQLLYREAGLRGPGLGLEVCEDHQSGIDSAPRDRLRRMSRARRCLDGGRRQGG